MLALILGLQGQIEEGVMMGIGHCLTEEFILENGYVITDRLARYRIPGIMLTPKSHPLLSKTLRQMARMVPKVWEKSAVFACHHQCHLSCGQCENR